jgi:GNAT superfamily N-acetyltransferase
MEIRPARESELAELFRIQLHALGLTEVMENLNPGEVPALVRHGFENGQTVVAVEDDQLSGFAVGFERDGTWFLGEFFVRPDVQSRGAGQALLASIQPEGIPCATMTTGDYRAQALYARAGMTPLWPSFNLRAEISGLKRPEVDARAIEMTAVSPSLLAWDSTISGRQRPKDLAFLIDGWQGALLWIERNGVRIGYAGIARRGGGRISIGPVGVRLAADATAAVLATIVWASRNDELRTITIDVPGHHPALRALLDCGFRIQDQNLFCASGSSRFGDPTRYLPITPAVY